MRVPGITFLRWNCHSLLSGLKFFIEYRDTGNHYDIAQKMCSKLPKKSLEKYTTTCSINTGT